MRLPPSPLLAVCIGFSVLTASSLAQKDAAPVVRAGIRNLALAGGDAAVRLDVPGAGTVRAAAATYEVEFSARGAQFTPFLGSLAQRSYPFQLALTEVRVGARPLGFAPHSDPEPAGDWVHFERGSVRESYAVSAAGIEQVLVLDGGGPGEIAVRIAVATELTGKTCAGGILFELPGLGGVHYGKATAFDAAGHETPVATEWRGGSIELTVPAEFVAAATFPVTIDPIIKTVSVETSAADTFFADVAINDSLGQALVCYEYAFSQADHGVYVQRFELLGGSPIASPVLVASGSDNWRQPKIAYNEASDVFLVVAQAGPAGSRVIRGRILNGTTSSPGTPFTISEGTGSPDSTAPDVGGDPNPQGPTTFCVAWQVQFTPDDRDLWARLVTPAGTLVGPAPLTIDYTSADDGSVTVSKTNGRPPAASQAWSIVWDRRSSILDYDIYGRQIDATGTFLGPAFAIENSGAFTGGSSVSSLTDESTGARRYLVTWTNDLVVADTDVFGVVLSGSTPVTPIANLSELQAPGDTEDQIYAATDSDGFRFVVAASESYQGSVTDLDMYAATYHFVPATGTIGITEGHVNLAYSGTREDNPEVAAVRSSGSNPAVDPTRYAVVWDDLVGTDNHDVEAAIYEGTTGGGVHEVIATTCGGSLPLLTAGGIPALGNIVSYTLTVGTGWPLMLIGTYSLYPLCPAPCALGVYPIWMLAVPALVGPLPSDPVFLGLDFYVQGLEVLPAPLPGCPLPIKPSVTIRTHIE